MGLNEELNLTVLRIEKALEDLRKGTATREEVIGLINQQVEKDKAALTSLEEKLNQVQGVRNEVGEVKETADQMRQQIRRLMAGGMSAMRDSNGTYRGRFQSMEEARIVGLSIMAGAMQSHQTRPEVSAKYTRVLKALEKGGVDMKFIEPDTGRPIEKAATTGSQASGSLLVTSETAPGILMLLESFGLARRLAAQVPMGASQTLTPKMDLLPTFYVPGEGTAPTATDPTIGAVLLVPKTLMALGAYSMELDADAAPAIGELYGTWFARGAAYYEDLCWLLGDGTSTYFGFTGICGALRRVDVTISNIKSLVVGSGNAYSELVHGDFAKVVGMLPDYADSGASWIMHRYFYYTVVVRAALAVGAAPAQEILLGTAMRQKLLCGYPVNFSQVMPKVEANSQICALFGDYSLGSQLGSRGGLEFASSDQVYFDRGLIGVRCRDRIAIAVPGVGSTTQAGPIVGLITAES
ncbi:MAG TPA: phage major capsid protein [Anaerohalosphaeraceae bacterium]|nr:phage major capsid protein [Anaerohalosphaeraceae bacterium]